MQKQSMPALKRRPALRTKLKVRAHFLPQEERQRAGERIRGIKSQLYRAGIPLARRKNAALMGQTPISINNYTGKPVFLKVLKVGKDSSLLTGLATDLAKLHKMGFGFPHVNIWQFYRRGNTYLREVIGVERFQKISADMQRNEGKHKSATPVGQVITKRDLIEANFNELKKNLGKKAYSFFLKEYFKAYPDSPQVYFKPKNWNR